MMNRKEASSALLFIFSITILFHLLVLCGIISYSIVWGGQLKSKTQMYIFEFLSILLNGFLIYIVLQKMRYVKRKMSRKWLNYCLIGFSILFLLNTVGNLFANNSFEQIFGTILTGLSAIFCWVLAKSKEPYRSGSH